MVSLDLIVTGSFPCQESFRTRPPQAGVLARNVECKMCGRESPVSIMSLQYFQSLTNTGNHHILNLYITIIASIIQYKV